LRRGRTGKEEGVVQRCDHQWGWPVELTSRRRPASYAA
jgi:hypothetical protein